MSLPTSTSETIPFGLLLKQLRKRAGMTQRDLAAALHYSDALISNLEHGQRQPDLNAVATRFVPALGLQDDPALAARLFEAAAAARGERVPAMALPLGNGREYRDDEKAHSARLPLAPTELIGRDEEVNHLCNRLLEHKGRLLTLVGPPGVGKSRLGLAVTEKMQELYRDGVYYVPLASVEDAELVAATIANTLGINSDEQRTSVARLLGFLRRKEALLLLDNFEQITAAAPLVAEILASCPQVHILVTSRERLHLRAEQRYRVPPLNLDSALALFVQRAQASVDDFEVHPDNQPALAQICRQLDCLPLAIELSAARMDLFTPQTLLARLRTHRLDLLSDGPRDLPARQRTLYNAIQRSYTLLDDSERRLFRLFGVFAGDFDTEAVVELGGSEKGLQSLIDKSLVQISARPEGVRRFLLLETLRDFAWRQLSLQGESVATQQRYALFYLRLAEEAASNMRGPAQVLWINRLSMEVANLRAALASSLADQQSETAVRLGVALWRFWDVRGHYEEGMQWLQRLLVLPCESRQRADLFYGCGMLARRLGDFGAARENLTASLALYRELGDQRGIASALRGLGFIHYVQQDGSGARLLFEEALTLFRALDDLDGIAVTLHNLAYITSDPEEEKRYLEQSLALRRRTGNHLGVMASLNGLIHRALKDADHDAARCYAQEHQQISEALAHLNGIATTNLFWGHIAAVEDELETARQYYEQAANLCRQIDDRFLLPVALHRLAMTLLRQEEIESVTSYLIQAMELYQEQGQGDAIAELLGIFANLALAQGLAQRVLTLAGAALALSPSMLEIFFPIDQAIFERTQSTARQLLDPQAADAAWTAGQKLSLEQAITFALTG